MRAWAGCGRSRKSPSARWKCCGERKPGKRRGLTLALFMNIGLWQRLRHYSLRELATAVLRLPGRAVELLKLPRPMRRN